MTFPLILFSMLSASADAVKMALMPPRLSRAWCICWGIAAGVLTVRLSAVPRQAVFSLLGMQFLVPAALAELALMSVFLFASGRLASVLRFYPGLMLSVPLSLLSLAALSSFPGVGFGWTGLAVGGLSALSLAAAVRLLRVLRVGESALYLLVLCFGLLCILFYGML